MRVATIIVGEVSESSLSFQAANVQQQLIEIKAANQSAQYLGNKVEMAITTAIEKNKALLRVGLHFEYGDCRFDFELD